MQVSKIICLSGGFGIGIGKCNAVAFSDGNHQFRLKCSFNVKVQFCVWYSGNKIVQRFHRGKRLKFFVLLSRKLVRLYFTVTIYGNLYNNGEYRCRLLSCFEAIAMVNPDMMDRGIPGCMGVSRPREFHPQPLAESDVNLSAHPAPIIQPFGMYPFSQCTNFTGIDTAILSRVFIARPVRRTRLLCLRINHRIR